VYSYSLSPPRARVAACARAYVCIGVLMSLHAHIRTCHDAHSVQPSNVCVCVWPINTCAKLDGKAIMLARSAPFSYVLDECVQTSSFLCVRWQLLVITCGAVIAWCLFEMRMEEGRVALDCLFTSMPRSTPHMVTPSPRIPHSPTDTLNHGSSFTASTVTLTHSPTHNAHPSIHAHGDAHVLGSRPLTHLTAHSPTHPRTLVPTKHTGVWSNTHIRGHTVTRTDLTHSNLHTHSRRSRDGDRRRTSTSIDAQQLVNNRKVRAPAYHSAWMQSSYPCRFGFHDRLVNHACLA
jgi:hypothetical protein